MLTRCFLALAVLWVAALPALADPPTMKKEYDGHGGPIAAVSFHPQGHQISFGTARGMLRVRDLETPENSANLLDAAGWLAYSPIVVAADPNGLPTGGPSLITLSPQRRLSIWYPDTWQRQGWSDDAGTSGALSADGRVLAVTDGQRDIFIWPMHHWDPSYHAIAMPRPDVSGYVTALALNHDGKLMATGYRLDDGTGRFVVWDRPVGRIVHSEPLSAPPGAVAYSPVGSLLAVGGSAEDGKGFIRLLQPHGAPSALLGSAAPVSTAAFSPDEKRLAVGRTDGAIDVWDVGRQSVVVTVPAAHKGAVRALAWQPGGRALASGGEDGFVRIWDL